MAEGRKQPRFSIAVHGYLWSFFALLGLLPAFVMTRLRDNVPFSRANWLAAQAWPVAIALLYLYASKVCSGDNMTFRNGLLRVTSSMLGGSMYLSFMTVFPALLAAFCGAVFVALYGDLRRDDRYAPERWLQIVKFVHRHRMRQ